MRASLPVVVAILTTVAGPALACRPHLEFTAAFGEEPLSAPDDFVLFGRIVRATEYVPGNGDGAPSVFDPSALYLFGVLDRPGQPPVRVYRRALLSSCDRTPPGIFDGDVWIVGRPLPEDGAGARVSLMVLRRSGVWRVE